MANSRRSGTEHKVSYVKLALLRRTPAVLRWWCGAGRKATGQKRLLVIRPDHIGDILLTTPALRLLRSSLPEASITYLVGPWSQRVIAGNPNVDQVLVHDFSWFNRRKPRHLAEPYLQMIGLVQQLRDTGFDIGVNLRPDFWFGALLMDTLGIPRRIGYDVLESKPFLTDTIRHAGRLHEAERNLRLVGFACGKSDEQAWKPGDGSLDFFVSEGERQFADNYLRSQQVGSEDALVALHPCSGWPTKRWAPDRFAEVGDEISRLFGAKLILTGTDSERTEIQAIAQRMKAKAIVAAGETTLGQLAAILERCTLVVGMDSGVLHLAVAMGSPSVHLFGPSDHLAFGPWGDPNRHLVVRKDQECTGCGEMFHCARGNNPPDCMLSIEVSEVLAAARKAIAYGARRPSPNL